MRWTGGAKTGGGAGLGKNNWPIDKHEGKKGVEVDNKKNYNRICFIY